MSRNVLDELVRMTVFKLLKRWRIATDKVGRGFGQSGWSDEQVRRALTGTGKTFHTRDKEYYKPAHRHSTYSLVFYDVKDDEMA